MLVLCSLSEIRYLSQDLASTVIAACDWVTKIANHYEQGFIILQGYTGVRNIMYLALGVYSCTYLHNADCRDFPNMIQYYVFVFTLFDRFCSNIDRDQQ